MQNLMINFSIPKPLLSTVDQLAAAEMKTRSELVRDALRDYLERRLVLKNQWEAVFAYGEKKAKRLKISSNQLEALVDDYREGK